MKKRIFSTLTVCVFCACGLTWAIVDMVTVMKRPPYNGFITGIVSIALFFIALCSAVVIHEAGHVFWCHWAGSGVAILDLPFVSFRFNDQGVTVKRNNMTGGLVVPILEAITTIDDYIRQKRFICLMLICGPLASVVSGVTVGMIPVLLGESSGNVFSFCLHTYCNLFLLSQVFIVFNSYRMGNSGVGDCIAVDKMDRDDVYFESYVFGCMLQRVSANRIIEKSKYLQTSMTTHLEGNKSPFEYINYIEWLLEYALSEEHTFLDEYLGSKIDIIVSEAVERITVSEDGTNDYASIAILSLEYMITKLSEKEKALKICEEVLDVFKSGDIGETKRKQFNAAWRRIEEVAKPRIRRDGLMESSLNNYMNRR